MAKNIPHVYHHFIPQCYLQNFAKSSRNGTDREIVQVRYSGNGKFFPKNIADICGEDHLYRIPDIISDLTEEQRLIIEKGFYAKNVESIYQKVYETLISERVEYINNDLKADILLVTLSLYFRNPKYLENLNNETKETVEFLNGFVERRGIEKEPGEIFFNYRGEIRKILSNEISQFESEQYELNKWVFLTQHIKDIQSIIKKKMINGIMVSKLVDAEFEYITSDNPISVRKIGFDHADIFDDDSIITLPLDSKHLFTIVPVMEGINPLRIGRLDNDKFNALVNNLEVEKNSKSWIIGNEISVKKHEADQQKYGEDSHENRAVVELHKKRLLLFSELSEYIDDHGIRAYDPFLFNLVYKCVRSGYFAEEPKFKNLVKKLETDFHYRFY